MADAEPAPTWRDFLTLEEQALLAQCEFDRFRASGPGGQKRNVSDSAVRLRHRPSGLAAEANESRSQHENRRRALARLRRTIALAPSLRAPVALESYAPPSEVEAVRGKDGRIAVGRRDARFLPALAAIFDLLEACEWRLSDAAKALGISTAALGRLLVSDSAVWRAASERRRALDLPPLRDPAERRARRR